MDNCSFVFALKGNSVILYFLFLSQKSSKNQEMSLKSSGNNVFAVEDTNDNITGIDNHKHIMKSIYDLWQLARSYMHVCVWI